MSDSQLRDLQSETDYRNLEIQKVGVKGLSYPITVQDRANGTQQTVASVTMSVLLPHRFRGTHMSRFVEILNRHRGNIASNNLKEILGEMKEASELPYQSFKKGLTTNFWEIARAI